MQSARQPSELRMQQHRRMVVARKTTNKSSIKINAFTILELIVVIAGLGILASLGIPNLLKYLEQVKIDQAIVLLNSAAAECIQMYRSEGISALNKKPSILQREKLPDGYSYQAGQDKCQTVAIEDPSDPESLLVTLGFLIDNKTGAPKVSKFSEYKHPDTKYACEQWGGCGEGANVQAIIEEQKRRAEEKARLAAIEERYNAWLKGPPPGTGNYTQDGKNVWAFQGRVVADQEKFNQVIVQECGKELAVALNNAITSKYDGLFTYNGKNGGCTTNTYLCSGADVKTKEAYDACKKKQWDDACDAELLRRKANNINGLFEKLADGRGCNAVYLCNGTEWSTQAGYDSSPCGKKEVCTTVKGACTTITTNCRSVRTTCAKPLFNNCFQWNYATQCDNATTCQPDRQVCEWK